MRKVLEAISLGALAVLFWITCRTIYDPERLPERIPTHFDLAGRPNGWSSPTALLLLPVVAAAIYLGITLTSRFPSAFHYPVRVTPQNRPRLQALSLQLIVWLKTELMCLFAWIQWSIVEAVRNGGGSLSLALVPLSLLVVFATVGWHVVAMFRAANPGSGS